MPARDIRIRSSEGPGFDLHLAMPTSKRPMPAIVLASAIHGVDEDIRAIAAEFASHGYIAAAPDLFWRTVPGPLPRSDPRAAQRAQPRLEKIQAGERDLEDVLRALRDLPMFNGRAAVMGFCYSGPYAIIAPERLGYDAGISCHGTQMLGFIDALADVAGPIRILWGDEDALAPADVREACAAVASSREDIEVHVLPGVKHGYMMRGNAGAFDPDAYRISMECSLAVMASLGSRRRAG